MGAGVVHELYKMKSFFCLCASVHSTLPFHTSAAEPLQELVAARSTFLFAALSSGMPRLNSGRKQFVFSGKQVLSDVGFTVLGD